MCIMPWICFGPFQKSRTAVCINRREYCVGTNSDAADVLFLRVLYRICNPILLSIRIFNPTTLTLLQVFYCAADCKSLY